ncbi:MAG TPA: Dam family site-specific DNA-(adenine-N6)-methyltransferase [Oligoflexia bacterium]|nr:Dam family site-specific DNA-(adenine-N6)-methyltransferase [Oligoflexia bacterium]HMP27032.1 Dam family site-specific DNA-(adenine-N6)-methyltransferase [Oligoflexia bacterium]
MSDILPLNKLTPPLKWAGGKRWLLPRLKSIVAGIKYNRLVEPFAGGLAISLGLLPRYALLNDINPHLINFYENVKKNRIIRGDFRNERNFYLRARDELNLLIRFGMAASRRAAELFYYLNRTGFNGLCRFNAKGEFNVPFGRYQKINYQKDFSKYSKIFRRWEFVSRDFAELKIKKGDLLYVDPPYDTEFTRYAQSDFGWRDQLRLVEWLKRQTAPMIVSNQATKRVLKLYREAGFQITIIKAPRRISANGDRPFVREMLATMNIY